MNVTIDLRLWRFARQRVVLPAPSRCLSCDVISTVKNLGDQLETANKDYFEGKKCSTQQMHESSTASSIVGLALRCVALIACYRHDL